MSAVESEDFSKRTIEMCIRNMCDAKNLVSIGKGGKADKLRFQIANASTYQEVQDFIDE